MDLKITPNNVEFIYDELDTNAINFQFKDGYFSIQVGVYIDEDDEEDDALANEPYFELNDQINSQAGGLEKIMFYNNEIVLFFKAGLRFLDKYSSVTIQNNTNRKIVDFFSNHLFFGKEIQYAIDFSEENIVPQTEFRERL